MAQRWEGSLFESDSEVGILLSDRDIVSHLLKSKYQWFSISGEKMKLGVCMVWYIVTTFNADHDWLIRWEKRDLWHMVTKNGCFCFSSLDTFELFCLSGKNFRARPCPWLPGNRQTDRHIHGSWRTANRLPPKQARRELIETVVRDIYIESWLWEFVLSGDFVQNYQWWALNINHQQGIKGCEEAVSDQSGW